MTQAASLPLWRPEQPDRPIAWRDGHLVRIAGFAQHCATLAQRLPTGDAMINVCEDRYRFMVAYAAAQCRRQSVLLPSSRAAQIVREVEESSAGSYRCDDAMVQAVLNSSPPLGAAELNVQIATDHVCMIGFTSGSTGQPQRFPKLWSSVSTSTARNAAAIRAALNLDAHAPVSIVATVPPQHIYGMEFSVLLPLIDGMTVHSGRPLFPADIAQALAQLPAPRVLVSTPVHLRAIVESAQVFPGIALIISATAPLDMALAQLVERRLGGQLLEIFGSTETCAIASRRTALESSWRVYEGVQLEPGPAGTLISTPWFTAPAMLQDIVELRGDHRFVVRGRNTDMIEVAGKRASLADLTRRLLGIEGVTDAVVFQPDPEAVATIRRVAALVVAPGLTGKQIVERLGGVIDPAFLPRPLRIVAALPRNELGKLSREALLQALRRTDR